MVEYITDVLNDDVIYREKIGNRLTATTTQKVQIRIDSNMESRVLRQIPANQLIELNHVQKIISTGKIRIKIYIEGKFSGWMSYQTDQGEDLIKMEDDNSLEIFNFPEGEIPLYD